MASLKVYNQEGNVVEEIEVKLDESLAERGSDALAASLVRQAANARKAIAHTKDRGAVSGGGQKPWRQKGTGHARHGSRRSPIFVHGGVTFGPTNKRNFTKDMNKKERKLAMRKAVYEAITDGRVALLQGFEASEPSTKRGVKLLNGVGAQGKTLFVHNFTERAVLKSFTNIPKLKMMGADRINAFDLLNNDNILCARDEFDKIRERWID